MKNILTPLLLFAALSLILGFSTIQNQKGLATVDQEQGLYIFIRSKPAANYEFLGKLNMPEVVWGGKPKAIAVRRAHKQFPNANGLIFQSENFGNVEAIKLSE
jgi:hypothetical protein